VPELLAALDVFLLEHLRCGELDGRVEPNRIRMACECGAMIAQPMCLSRCKGKGNG